MLSERNRRLLLKLKEKIILKCPKCKGQNPECSCLDEFRLEFKKVKANIPTKFRKATFEKITHPETVEVRAKLKIYIDSIENNFEEGKGLFMFGPNGTGKSILSCIVLIEALKKGMTAYFYTFDKVIRLYTTGWKDEIAKDLFDECIINKDFLVLDEVGNESRTNITLVKGCLNEILRQRCNNCLPTILLSNFHFNRIKDIYGEEVFSIINEACTPLEFNGIDYRQNVINGN